MAVKGSQEVTLGPGQTFYESPEDIHSVSKNASSTKPAKLLVFFVKEKKALRLLYRPSNCHVTKSDFPQTITNAQTSGRINCSILEPRPR